MTAAPAGWHPDPRGRHQHRYWDGTHWTEHVADAGRPSIDPVGPDPRSARASPVRPEVPVVGSPQPRETESLWARARPGPAPEAESAERGEAIAPAGPAEGGERPPAVAAVLSVVAPGSGHLFLGLQGPGRATAYALLTATILAVVISYVSLGTFLIGFGIWLTAAVYAVLDLRLGPSALRAAPLAPHATARMLVAGGTALAVALILPWYRIAIDSRGLSFSASGLEALDVLDLVLFGLGAASAAVGLATLGRGPLAEARLPPVLPLAMAVAGAVAVALVYFRMFVDPVPSFAAGRAGVSVGRAPGILLAGAAAIAICAAGAGGLRAGSRRAP